jgi:flagellar biosynthesis protein FliR
MNSVSIPLHPFLYFVVVLARVGGLVTFAPFWSNQAANARIRIALAVVLALVITPVVTPYLILPPPDFIGLAVAIIRELAIGCLFGFIGRLVFTALDMAAQILGLQLGLSLVNIIDPATKASTTALGTIAQMFGLMVMLAAEGHHWMLAATVRSFAIVKTGEFTFTPALMQLLLRLFADALAMGVALAAPAIIVLLAVEFTLAIVGRAAPQLQVMLLGFPVKFLFGVWLVGTALYFMPGAVRQTLSLIKRGLSQALTLMQ